MLEEEGAAQPVQLCLITRMRPFRRERQPPAHRVQRIMKYALCFRRPAKHSGVLTPRAAMGGRNAEDSCLHFRLRSPIGDAMYSPRVQNIRARGLWRPYASLFRPCAVVTTAAGDVADGE